MPTRKTYSIKRSHAKPETPVKVVTPAVVEQPAKAAEAPVRGSHYQASTYIPRPSTSSQEAVKAVPATLVTDTLRPAYSPLPETIKHERSEEEIVANTSENTPHTTGTVNEENVYTVDDYEPSENTQPETLPKNNYDFRATNIVITTSEEFQPNSWVVAYPEKSEEAVLNFYNNHTLMCSVPLSQDNMETLIPVLDNFYIRPQQIPKIKGWKAFTNWYKNHKILGTITILIGIIVTANIIASLTLNGVY